MPRIQPFRGLRYNLAKVGALSNVIAPPYDVVDAELQRKLYGLSPYNFIQLELTQSDPSDGDDVDAKYRRAANQFRTWIRDGVLQQEPDAAIYVYHQSFDAGGRTFTRRGFMSRLRLVRFGEGNIYPHEETHAKAKDDRLRLTRACEANLSQIFGLYPDPSNQSQNLLEAHIAGTAGLEAVDHLGVVHRLWPITNQKVIAELSNAVEDLPLFVADGHHRFETACNYRDELASAAGGSLPGEHAANYCLSMLMSMDDPGLIVMPTHRLFSGVPDITAVELAEKIGDAFDCETAGNGADRASAVWKEIEELNDQGAMAFYTAADNTWTLATANQSTNAAMQKVAPEQSEDWRSLGVALLHRLIIDERLGLRGHPKPTYVHLVDEVVQGLRGELEGNLRYPLAALVMPATVEDIRKVSLHGERMPAKSTYFYPKLVSGLVVNSLSETQQ